jgi:hypothetical protein
MRLSMALGLKEYIAIWRTFAVFGTVFIVGFSTAFGQETNDDAAEAAALAFLRGLDAGDLVALYQQAGPTLKYLEEESDFVEAANVIRREGRGAALSRVPTDRNDFSKSAQHGKFYYIQYTARYPSGKRWHQDIYLEKIDADWRVSSVWTSPSTPQ